MCPWRMATPSVAWDAVSGPARWRIWGRTPGLAGEVWTTTKTAAGRVGGNPRNNSISAWTPPALAPITMMSRPGEGMGRFRFGRFRFVPRHSAVFRMGRRGREDNARRNGEGRAKIPGGVGAGGRAVYRREN